MNDPKAHRRLRHLLFALVMVLTFEGLLRKMAPPAAKLFLFILKDLVVIWIAFQVARMRVPIAIRFLLTAYTLLAVLMLPVILATAVKDPLLAIFGAKQYLLFPVVGLAVFLAFEHSASKEIFGHLRWIALLVIPTTLTAMLQSRLPNNHWLNLSVGGGSLEGFSAAGQLRVSSTFAFVAQFTMFLNAQIFIYGSVLSHLRIQNILWKIVILMLLPLLVLGSYITGSRGAVLGNVAVVMLACGLTAMKQEAKVALRLVMLLVGLYLAFLAGQYFNPDAFLAYSAREEGKLASLSADNQERISSALFGWATNPVAPPNLLGYGLGVMSNGSDILSRYAASWRATGAWTETDMASTLFEGGYYLVVVWYGFRGYIIYQLARRFFGGVAGAIAAPAGFCLSYVVVIGITGTLGMQPPMAIWWWFGVGLSLVLWWKCVEPASHETEPETYPPYATFSAGHVQGRSVFAEQLHGARNDR
jgi:hypothetical protein